MLKKWWQSRTIWAALTTIALAVASLFREIPDSVNDALSVGQIISGALTIYFRNTTTVGVASIFTDNRFTGQRTP